MTTTPAQEILPPVQRKTALILERFGNLIDETRAFGTHVLNWHMDSAVGGDNVVPITLSIRHILELMGAISSCVRNSNIDPCKVLLRAMLESFLGLAYMLKEDTRRRAFAFLAVEAQQRLKQLRMFDPSTEEGARYVSAANNAYGSRFSHGISPEEIASAIHRTEDFLKTDGVREAVAEVVSLRKNKKKNNPNWYSLYGGPANLADLATAVGHQLLYLIFYGYWSRSIHGTNVIQGKIVSSPSGGVGIVQLGFPGEAQSLTQFTVTLALNTYGLILQKYCPEKVVKLRKWYASEVQSTIMELTEKELIVVNMPS